MLTYADLCSLFLTDTDTDSLSSVHDGTGVSDACMAAYFRLLRASCGGRGGARGGGLVSVACAVAGMPLLAAHERYAPLFCRMLTYAACAVPVCALC